MGEAEATGGAGDEDDAIGEVKFREAFRGAEVAGGDSVGAEVGVFLGRRLRGRASRGLGRMA